MAADDTTKLLPPGVHPARPTATDRPTASGRPADTTAFYPAARTDPPRAAAPVTDHDLRPLLRRRLVVLTALYLAAVTYLFVIPGLLGRDLGNHHDYGPLPDRVVGFLAVAVCGGGLALVAVGRGLGVGALRVVELAAYGAMTLFIARYQYTDFVAAHAHPLAATPHAVVVYKSTAYTSSVHWFILILLYGLVVPNTWRRCLAVTAVDFVTALAVYFAIFPLDLGEEGFLAPALAGTALTLTIAVGVAVFGSFKIGSLQKQVRAARELIRELGQYRLTRRLGEGGMGEVYLAEHRLLKRPCAVKFVRADLVADPRVRARFRREVEAMARLTHPNTVEIYDYGQADDGTFFYVMEYLSGLTLQQVADRTGRLDPGRVVYVLRQVCAALREAHAAGLVHRDVKPGNVFLTDRGGTWDVVKLLDFGLVRLADHEPADHHLTQTGMVLGTPGYMSPEQAAGEGTPDGRSDLYSVGAVGYFLLTGRPPFAGKSAARVIAAQLTESAAPVAEARPDVPADLAAVIDRCLARDPDDRFAHAGQLEQALAGCDCAADWSADRAAGWWRDRGPACPPGPA